MEFDTVIAIDWSASSTPKQGANSIWIATSDGELLNPATRHLAERQLHDLLARASGRVLVAVDVALGYPAGTAAALGVSEHQRGAWWATWELIASLSIDDEHNRNNRFEVAAELNRRIGECDGPFWGRPPSFDSHDSARWLSRTKPTQLDGLAEFRATELALRAAGYAPKSVWQLLGAGAVGSQSLTAIPMLHRLVSSDDRVSVWPFMPPTDIVIAEVWPSLYLRPSSAPAGVVADAAQVRAVVDAFSGGAHLTIRTGAAPDSDEVPSSMEATVAEEGWVLAWPFERKRAGRR